MELSAAEQYEALRWDWALMVQMARDGEADLDAKDDLFHRLGRLWVRMKPDERREIGLQWARR